MDVKNTHSVTKTEISVFGRQALDAERRRSPSLADKVLNKACNLTLNMFLNIGPTNVHAFYTFGCINGQFDSIRSLPIISTRQEDKTEMYTKTHRPNIDA